MTIGLTQSIVIKMSYISRRALSTLIPPKVPPRTASIYLLNCLANTILGSISFRKFPPSKASQLSFSIHPERLSSEQPSYTPFTEDWD
jgi:hypothetical protein